MVRAQMERDLRMYGGVGNIGPLAPVDVAKPETPKPRLYLTCRRFDATTKAVCGHAWESDTFTPCPKCGNRQFVTKAERPQPPPETPKTETVDPILGAL